MIRACEKRVRTTLTLTLVDGYLVIRGPVYNRDLCAKILKMALERLDMEQQVDAGAGGQRLLIPDSNAKLTDLYHRGKRKV